MIEVMAKSWRWSPFIKSIKNRSIMSAAIIGQQIDVCRMILMDCEFPEIIVDKVKAKKSKAEWLMKPDPYRVFGKDDDDNNILHLCYIYDMNDVRVLLRKKNLVKVEHMKKAYRELRETLLDTKP